MSVTNPLKQSAKYEKGQWTRSEFTEDFINDKLDNMKQSYSTLLYYGAGVWITSLSRQHLMDIVLYSKEFDKCVCYCDTDSVKYFGDFDYVFEWYNKKVYKHYKELCKRFKDLNIEDFEPLDPKGNKHPIGCYEFDGFYSEFKTLGAKKYVAREDGKLHLTVSGVAKSGVIALNDNIDNFKKGLVFDYNTSGKLTHFYNDNQPETDIIDYERNVYHSTISYGITLAPTTYTLGTTELYDLLIEKFLIEESERNKKS